MSFGLAAETEGAPFSRDTLELISCVWPGRGEAASGETEFSECKEAVLSDGESRLDDRWCAGGIGGARDLPVPNILPPPSFREAMAGVNMACCTWSLCAHVC
jgi:hypothetical protein